MKIYVVKLYDLFKYLGYTDNQLINLIANLQENKYSDAYKLYHQLDEFQLVKYKQLGEGPVAYTTCNSRKCAVQRFKDELLPISPLGVQSSVDKSLLANMLIYNTREADDEMRKNLAY